MKKRGLAITLFCTLVLSISMVAAGDAICTQGHFGSFSGKQTCTNECSPNSGYPYCTTVQVEPFWPWNDWETWCWCKNVSPRRTVQAIEINEQGCAVYEVESLDEMLQLFDLKELPGNGLIPGENGVEVAGVIPPSRTEGSPALK